MRKRGWSLRRWVRSASEVWVMITPEEHNLLLRAYEERDTLQRRFTTLQHIAGRLQMELDEVTRNENPGYLDHKVPASLKDDSDWVWPALEAAALLRWGRTPLVFLYRDTDQARIFRVAPLPFQQIFEHETTWGEPRWTFVRWREAQ